jgi:hypothetical protein
MEASLAEVVKQPISDLPIPDLFGALDQSTSQFGAFHPQTISVVNRLAVALWKVGDTRQAIGLLDRAQALISAHLGHRSNGAEGHGRTVGSRGSESGNMKKRGIRI